MGVPSTTYLLSVFVQIDLVRAVGEVAVVTGLMRLLVFISDSSALV